MAWRSISDFTPGIREILAPNYPLGTLQSNGTYRCFATDTGALAPLPSRVNNFFLDSPDIASTEAQLLNLTSPEASILGLHAKNPVFWPGQTLAGVDQNNTELLLGLGYYHTTPGVSTRSVTLFRLMRHHTVPGWQQIWDWSQALDLDLTARPPRMTFADGRSNSANPDVGGPVVVGFTVDGRAFMYPDDTNTAATSTRYLPGDNVLDVDGGGFVYPAHIVAHQGRAVLHPLLLTDGGFQSIYPTNEAFYFTTANNWTERDASLDNDDINTFFQLQVGHEHPTGYQVIHSLNASELVMLKSSGGAIVMQGDLGGSGLRAIAYPSVRSPGLSLNNGTPSPIGLIYPVDGSGIWLWAGGEQSEHLTPHMNPDFWRPPTTLNDGNPSAYGHGYTSCSTWQDWVVLPNNYLYDTSTKSLWRYENPAEATHHHVTVDWRGRFMYAAPSGIINVGEAAVQEYDARYPASSYQARTQPLALTIDQQLTVHRVGIVASGAGRVTLTPTTRQNPVGQPVTFEVGAEDAPLWRRTQNVNVSGSHITFTVNSAGVTDSSPAPTVHEILWDDDTSTPERQ